MSKGPTKARPTPRELSGIPGTVRPGFREEPVTEEPLDELVRSALEKNGVDHSEFRVYRMGPCGIFVNREPAGPGGALLWHMSISTPSRYPTWDEIKVARYRLLPVDVDVAMILPPPDEYVNVPEQDCVMHVWQIVDARVS